MKKLEKIQIRVTKNQKYVIKKMADEISNGNMSEFIISLVLEKLFTSDNPFDLYMFYAFDESKNQFKAKN